MWRSPEPRYDVASGLSQGGRDYQEDALVTDFPFGMDSGIAVLADGMGGHEAGDVASKIVVTEVYSELKFSSATFGEDEQAIPQRLARATASANSTIRDHVTENQSTYLPLGATHRLDNPGKIPLELIEVQSGSYLGEDDIVRFDDVYGRSGTTNDSGTA